MDSTTPITPSTPGAPPEHASSESIPPVTIPYFAAPTEDVFVTDAAIRAMGKSRPCAMLCAVGMFIYAIVGGGLGVMWLCVAVFGNPSGLLEFVILIPPNLIGSPLALTGGILAIRYHRAITRALARRNPEDFERALAIQLYIWRWACLSVFALFAMPFIILAVGHFAGVGK